MFYLSDQKDSLYRGKPRSPCVLVSFCFVIKKNLNPLTKYNFGRKKAYMDHTSLSQSITERCQGRDLKQTHGRMLFGSLLGRLSYTAQAHCLRMVLPTVDCVLLHQLSVKTISSRWPPASLMGQSSSETLQMILTCVMWTAKLPRLPCLITEERRPTGPWTERHPSHQYIMKFITSFALMRAHSKGCDVQVRASGASQ